MWISRVEDIDAQRENVQISNPFMMQNNTNSLRSPFAMASSTAGKAGDSTNMPGEVGVIVSISGRRGEAVGQANALSGIDVDLFAAD